MSKLSVSIPENLLDTINQRIESGDYSSISDYIRDLIRRDMKQPQRAGQGMTNSEGRIPGDRSAGEVLPLP